MNILIWTFLATLFWAIVALAWTAYLTPAHALCPHTLILETPWRNNQGDYNGL